MAKEAVTPEGAVLEDPKAEKKRLKEEKKRIKEEMKRVKAEARLQEEGEEEGGSALPVVLVTIFIILIWLAILALLIKLDVGGFGSGVLRPVLKDIPVVNKILPAPKSGSDEALEEEDSEYAGYSSVKEAVDQIKELQLQIDELKKGAGTKDEQMTELNAEIARLKTFENNQVEFEKIKNQFYEEVVFTENGPGVQEYMKYYESIDPANAENLYKQAVQQTAADAEIQNYAKTYSAMKPKQAAGIFEAMTDDLDRAAKILNAMSTDDRGAILGAMDAEVAAMLTKILDPED